MACSACAEVCWCCGVDTKEALLVSTGSRSIAFSPLLAFWSAVVLLRLGSACLLNLVAAWISCCLEDKANPSLHGGIKNSNKMPRHPSCLIKVHRR